MFFADLARDDRPQLPPCLYQLAQTVKDRNAAGLNAMPGDVLVFETRDSCDGVDTSFEGSVATAEQRVCFKVPLFF